VGAVDRVGADLPSIIVGNLRPKCIVENHAFRKSFVGRLKGVSKVYLHAVVDSYGSSAASCASGGRRRGLLPPFSRA
jgi:hypothetical protein